MVATDGHRLAYVDRSLGSAVQGLASGVIIPRKGLAELRRLVDEEDADEVELGFAGQQRHSCARGGVTLTMRLIEGEFPNYRQVIPREANDPARAARRSRWFMRCAASRVLSTGAAAAP